MAKYVNTTDSKMIKQPIKRPGKHAKKPNKRFDRKPSRGQG